MIRKRLLAVLLLAAAAAGGCTASSESAAPGMADSQATVVEPEVADRGSGGTQAPEAAKAEQISQPGVDRKLIRTATIDLTAPDVGDALFEARGIATELGGYTGRSQADDRRATVTLHVPSDRFDEAVTRLAEIGEVTSSSQTAEDVTEQLVDVKSRIETQRVSVDRVRALLSKATSLDDIVQLEAELTRRQADLESLVKRRETLAGQVAVSTVTVRIDRANAPPPVVEEDDGLVAALATGWRAFTDSLGFLLRFVAVVLPFAVVLAIPSVLIWRQWRRNAKRRRIGDRGVARELGYEGGPGVAEG